MSFETPRLRMFAGPNGSGKSTIKDVINKELLGIYQNNTKYQYLRTNINNNIS